MAKKNGKAKRKTGAEDYPEEVPVAPPPDDNAKQEREGIIAALEHNGFVTFKWFPMDEARRLGLLAETKESSHA